MMKPIYAKSAIKPQSINQQFLSLFLLHWAASYGCQQSIQAHSRWGHF